MTNPVVVLREAIRAVPAVKYALGIGGVVAAVAIVYAFKIDARVAFVGAIVMLVLMGILVVFARMSSLASARMHLPALVFTWFVLLIFMALSVSLFTSVFYQKPLNLAYWLTGSLPEPKHEPTTFKACRLPEFGIEKWQHTEDIGQSSGWRGGGRSQQDWCNELISSLVTGRSIGPEHEATVLSMKEDSEKDLLGHARYNYYCKVRLSWQPLYAERQDPKCGAMQ